MILWRSSLISDKTSSFFDELIYGVRERECSAAAETAKPQRSVLMMVLKVIHSPFNGREFFSCLILSLVHSSDYYSSSLRPIGDSVVM